MNEKSILEQALLQVNTLEEAVKQNAKGILSSVMKQELNELLKESEMEEEDDAMAIAGANPEEEETQDMSEQPADEEDAADEDNDDLASINDEPSKDIDGEDEDSETEDEDEPEMDDEIPSMDDMDMPADDDDMLDMTGASDEEVLKVFKAMSDEDGIVVKKDGNNIELSDDGDEYIIKLDESEDVADEDIAEDEMSDDEFETEVAEEEETVYEIELDDEDDSEEEETHEEEVGESAHTKAFGQKGGLDSKKVFKAGRKEINEEVENLKKQNGEYKKALVMFKEKLNEVAVFNANLAYATRLFTEHSTTKQEKLNILKRFDSISTITESKSLYNSIKNELDTKKPVTESIADKIANTASSSSSQEVLSESKAYEAPQFSRMRDLMRKIK
jgi:hypothetical protein